MPLIAFRVSVPKLLLNFVYSRVYLKGPKAYQADVFLDRLPGLPDNIRSNGKDGFYIVMSYPRNSNEFDLFGTLGKLPYLRRFILRTILLVTSSLNYIEANFIPSPRLREWTIYIGNLGTLEDLPPKVIIVETDGIGNIIGNLQNDKGPVCLVNFYLWTGLFVTNYEFFCLIYYRLQD